MNTMIIYMSMILLVVTMNFFIFYWWGMVMITLILIYSSRKMLNMVFFFFIQEVGIILFMYFYIFKLSITMVPLLLKMGAPPLHFWVPGLLHILNAKSTLFFFSLAKIFPTILLMVAGTKMWAILIMGMATFFILLFELLLLILVCSSSFNIMSMFLFSFYHKSGAIIMMLMYYMISYYNISTEEATEILPNLFFLITLLGLPMNFFFLLKLMTMMLPQFLPQVMVISSMLFIFSMSYLKLFFSMNTQTNMKKSINTLLYYYLLFMFV